MHLLFTKLIFQFFLKSTAYDSYVRSPEISIWDTLNTQVRQCERRLWNDYSFIKKFFKIYSHKITPFYKPLYGIRSFRKQVRWLHRHFPSFICLIEVGCYFEAFDRSALKLNKATRLTLQEKWRGFSWGCGFPLCCLERVLRQLIDKSLPVVIVRQEERRIGTTRVRLPYLVITDKV